MKLTSHSLLFFVTAAALTALADVWKLQAAIPIDLGASGVITNEIGKIGFSDLIGTPVRGTLSTNFLFSNNQFVRLLTNSGSLFDASLIIQTSASGSVVGSPSGTGYLIDAHGNAIPGYGITGSYSSSDGSIGIGLFPLLRDSSGNPDTNIVRPLNFYGVHFDITFPVVNSPIVVTGGKFLLSGSGKPFGVLSAPILNVRKGVYLESSNLWAGTNFRFQLQVSADMNTWTNYGAPFTATNSFWRTTNYWDVDNWNSLFFRLQVSP